ncbi:MAG: nuclear transport factor 2 family protein [Pseudomonadota bacterium]
MEHQEISPEAVVKRFIGAFAEYDHDKMAESLADNACFHVTTADGGSKLVQGADAFMASVRKMDIKTVQPRVAITQILTVSDNQVMFMIEIKAERKGRSLHNFAAYLVEVDDGRISNMHMVEALPAYSDSFWND